MLTLYTQDGWLFKELNSGSKEGDQAKVDTLGPFAYAFGQIIIDAACRRTDIPDLKELLEVKGTKLYRGTALTKQELQKYKDLIGKKDEYGYPELMALTGFISTSMDRTQAETFAWSNKDSGHEATLFEIMWKDRFGYYVMDMSAFPHEREVLLVDGSKFSVMSVDQTFDKSGKPLNLIVLKCQYYD